MTHNENNITQMSFFLQNHKKPEAEIFAFRVITFAGNALEQVQRVHEPADLWDITF